MAANALLLEQQHLGVPVSFRTVVAGVFAGIKFGFRLNRQLCQDIPIPGCDGVIGAGMQPDEPGCEQVFFIHADFSLLDFFRNKSGKIGWFGGRSGCGGDVIFTRRLQ